MKKNQKKEKKAAAIVPIFLITVFICIILAIHFKQANRINLGLDTLKEFTGSWLTQMEGEKRVLVIKKNGKVKVKKQNILTWGVAGKYLIFAPITAKLYREGDPDYVHYEYSFSENGREMTLKGRRNDGKDLVITFTKL